MRKKNNLGPPSSHLFLSHIQKEKWIIPSIFICMIMDYKSWLYMEFEAANTAAPIPDPSLVCSITTLFDFSVPSSSYCLCC